MCGVFSPGLLFHRSMPFSNNTPYIIWVYTNALRAGSSFARFRNQNTLFISQNSSMYLLQTLTFLWSLAFVPYLFIFMSGGLYTYIVRRSYIGLHLFFQLYIWDHRINYLLFQKKKKKKYCFFVGPRVLIL